MNDGVFAGGRRGRSGQDRLPLDAVRDVFALLVDGPRPLSVDGRIFPGLPDRLVPLDELRASLMRRSCPAQTRDAVWAHLVTRSRREGGAWTVGCVGVALPGLARTAGWMAARYRGDRWDVHAAVVTGFLHGLATVELSEPRIAYRLWWTARRAGLDAVAEALNAPAPVESGFRSAAPRPPSGHPDFVLADAVAEGVISAVEADLIGATRLEEVSVTVWAAGNAVAQWAAYKMRSRAEQRLAGYLADRMRAHDPADPTATGADPRSHRRGRSLRVTGAGGAPDRFDADGPAPRMSKTAPGSGLLRRGQPAPQAASARRPEEPRCA